MTDILQQATYPDWDMTTTKSFLQSENARFYPEYWAAKLKIVRGLKPESRRGLLDHLLSVDLWRSVPQADGWRVRGIPDKYLQFPHLSEGTTVRDFFGGLLQGILLYDDLLWDASLLEMDLIARPSHLNEQMEISAGVSHVIELMEEGLIVPHCGHLGFTKDQERVIDKSADDLARDRVMQDIVKAWNYEDVDNADQVLPVFIHTLHYSQKYNASIISRGEQQKLYDRILWHSSGKMADKDVQNSLKEVLSVSIPTYRISTIDQLVSLKRENCVRRFRERVWSIFSSKRNNTDRPFELLRELDSDRKDLAEAMQTVSQMKLASSIVMLLVSPAFSVLPFPLNFGASAIGLAAKETAAVLMEKRHRKQYEWVFAIDKMRKLFVPWDQNRAR